MRAEADQRHHRHRHQRAAGAERRAHAFARPRWSQHEERQHQPGGHLHAHRRRQRARRRARALACARGPYERQRQRQQQQRVVVCAADRQHQQHRVQAHERRRPARRVAQARGRARDQRDRAEARDDRQRLERPQAAREAKRHQRVAEEREQRPVGGVLELPVDEPQHRVGGRFGGEVGVRVEAVQDAHACEREVAEDILGDQRRPQQQDRVGEHDRAGQRRRRQPPRDEQHEQVARAHDQHQRLEAAAGEAHAEPVQRTRQPRGPAAAARGDVLAGRRGGAGAHEKDARHDAAQPQRAERSREPRRHSRVGRRVRVRWLRRGDRRL